MVHIQPIDTVMAVWVKDDKLFELTQNAITSLKALDGIRLIIVDNDSSMGGGYLRNEADIYIRNQKNLGYAPAMNQGLKLCTSKYVAFAENDIRVSPNAFKVARDILDADGEIGTVHYRMMGYEEPLTVGKDVWKTGKERWCTISFMVWRKLAFPMGFFDEGYITANYEDWDIIHHARHVLGWYTAYTNAACYAHNDSYTQRQLDQTQREKEAQANREYFINKWNAYPEHIWEGLYMDQMGQQWRPFP